MPNHKHVPCGKITALVSAALVWSGGSYSRAADNVPPAGNLSGETAQTTVTHVITQEDCTGGTDIHKVGPFISCDIVRLNGVDFTIKLPASAISALPKRDDLK